MRLLTSSVSARTSGPPWQAWTCQEQPSIAANWGAKKVGSKPQPPLFPKRTGHALTKPLPPSFQGHPDCRTGGEDCGRLDGDGPVGVLRHQFGFAAGTDCLQDSVHEWLDVDALRQRLQLAMAMLDDDGCPLSEVYRPMLYLGPGRP